MSPRAVAGLAHAAPWIPIAASAGTIAALFVLPGDVNRAAGVVIGLGVALAAGVVIAFVAAPRSTPARANARSYALVMQRLAALHAHFDFLDPPPADPRWAELREARAQVELVERRLGIGGDVDPDVDPVDPSWSTGAAYQDLWTAIHRAEEAMLTFASVEELQASLLHDRLRVSGSQLATLTPELESIAKELPQKPSAADVAAITPRLRQVRRAVNEYRDERWDGLVRARLRLVRSAVTTAWTTYALLVLAIALQGTREAIGACAVFFVVGALVGLVAQVRSDARRDEAVEDYGLASARLYQTVLASGLAGVAGVLLTPLLAQLARSASEPGGVALPGTFNVSLNPGQLIPAAIFGLSPQVLFDRLKSSADQYTAQLSNTAAGAATSGGSVGETGAAG